MRINFVEIVIKSVLQRGGREVERKRVWGEGTREGKVGRGLFKTCRCQTVILTGVLSYGLLYRTTYVVDDIPKQPSAKGLGGGLLCLAGNCFPWLVPESRIVSLKY